MSDDTHFALDAALRRATAPTDERYARLLDRGAMTLGLYAPLGRDAQQPHTRDEIYVVVRGRGDFICDGARTAFEIGAALFVPAGVAHRFERFSDDLAVWVVFCGRSDGELPAPSAQGLSPA